MDALGLIHISVIIIGQVLEAETWRLSGGSFCGPFCVELGLELGDFPFETGVFLLQSGGGELELHGMFALSVQHKAFVVQCSLSVCGGQTKQWG